MVSELFIDFFERVAGAFIFITAIGALVLAINRSTASVTQVKNEYANDTAYSEAALAETDESIVSREELIASLLYYPNQNIVIKDEYSDQIVRIDCNASSDTLVAVDRGDSFSDNEELITFGKGHWDTSRLRLDEWLQAKQFTVHPVTKSDGTIESVLYYGSRNLGG